MRLCKNKPCRNTINKNAPKFVRWCSDECGTVLALSALEKKKAQAARAQAKAQKARTKPRKKNDPNDHSYQFDLTKKAAQKLANRLDSGLPCICCDEPRGKAQFCGGHAKSAGAHPELALDLRNIHGQRNVYCNQNKSGNWSGDKHSKGYRQGLIDRYGQSLVDWLESYHPPRKWTVDELRGLRALYAEETRRLDRGEGPSKEWRKV